jgi:hypothetical protein
MVMLSMRWYKLMRTIRGSCVQHCRWFDAEQYQRKTCETVVDGCRAHVTMVVFVRTCSKVQRTCRVRMCAWVGRVSNRMRSNPCRNQPGPSF